MDSTFSFFPVTDFERVKQQVLIWLNQFSTCCFLDNHQYSVKHHSYECIAAADAVDIVSANAGNALQQLQHFQQTNKGWLFGHLGYDLKNEIEDTHSANADHILFPDLFFFVPATVIVLQKEKMGITSSVIPPQQVFDAIANIKVEKHNDIPGKSLTVQPRFSKQDYISTVEKLRDHILRGDCYEINFCQEFYSDDAEINPLHTYRQLSDISPSPFAAFYKLDDRYLLCASPERYLKKQGDTIISQPIKGTGKRDLSNDAVDAASRQSLYNSQKNRSENVMVVDLVRNDLSRICREGSVKVDELFGIYSFPQVHQMISTVSGVLEPGLSFADIIRKTFPMGSMTGAPKKRVLELIDEYEITKRGLFSGAVGYIMPGGDFDFNVVIRSILYNSSSQYLSYQVGSAITFNSKAAEEYEECLLKAAAIKKVLE